jgi:hypothetical protein
MCRQLLHNCRSSSGENFFPFRAFAASVNAIVAMTKQYSNKSSERQSTETCSEKNLRPQALDFDKRDTVTVGVRGRKLRPVPPKKTRCKEPIVTALRMLLSLLPSHQPDYSPFLVELLLLFLDLHLLILNPCLLVFTLFFSTLECFSFVLGCFSCAPRCFFSTWTWLSYWASPEEIGHLNP